MKRSYDMMLAGSVGITAAVLLSATLAVPAPNDDAAGAAMAAIRPEGIRAGMRFLADDLLEGRGTGTRGYEIAARYVASRFEEIGLSPRGTTGRIFRPYRCAKAG